MDLPFKLPKRHKYNTLLSWKNRGLIDDNPEALYDESIYLTNCDLCGELYKALRDRQMEHEHLNGIYGPFRNFVCRRCNQLKYDVKIRTDNTSGYPGINKQIDNHCKQGFIWNFRVSIDGKNTSIKTSVDFDKLVKFAEQWKKENNYNT